jgi:hypothetical protein
VKALRRAALAVTAAAALLVTAPLSAHADSARTRTLHAAPNGSGAACTAARACSPEGARDAARAITGTDIRIELAGGTYALGSPLTLGAADSGPDGHTVTWTAAPGAHPVLSGGRTLSGWQPNTDGTWTAPVPALAGAGSTLSDNHTEPARLPRAALAVAATAGAGGHSPVEQLRPDLARTGTAAQSSTDGSATAAPATDGDSGTDTRTLSEPGAWWQTDLGANRHIGQVEVWNDASTTTADFDVQLSSTGDFTAATTTTVHVTGQALRPTLLTTDAHARYVRIRLTGTGRVGLAQVEVHP